MFTVMSYAKGTGRHRVVLVDTENGYQQVDGNMSMEVLTEATFLTRCDQFIFQRVVYLRKSGTLKSNYTIALHHFDF